jgi:hypothetical protein
MANVYGAKEDITYYDMVVWSIDASTGRPSISEICSEPVPRCVIEAANADYLSGRMTLGVPRSYGVVSLVRSSTGLREAMHLFWSKTGKRHWLCAR